MYRIVNAGQCENGLAKLQYLHQNELYDFWTEPSVKVPTDILVPETKITEFENYMNENGFTYTVMIDDVGQLIIQEKLLNKQGKNMDWDNYQRYETVIRFKIFIFILE